MLYRKIRSNVPPLILKMRGTVGQGISTVVQRLPGASGRNPAPDTTIEMLTSRTISTSSTASYLPFFVQLGLLPIVRFAKIVLALPFVRACGNQHPRLFALRGQRQRKRHGCPTGPRRRNPLILAIWESAFFVGLERERPAAHQPRRSEERRVGNEGRSR